MSKRILKWQYYQLFILSTKMINLHIYHVLKINLEYKINTPKTVGLMVNDLIGLERMSKDYE